MKFALPLLAIFAARFLVTAIAYPAGDGDLAWQSWLGGQILAHHAIPHTIGTETFSAPGSEWVPQEWLFGIGDYLTRGTWAWPIFSGFAALCAIAALWLVAWRARSRGASARAVAVCMLVAGVGTYESFGVRVQVIAWPLVALAVLVTDGPVRRRWWLVLIAALWSNVHASAMLAPIFAALAFAGDALEDRSPTPRVREGALIALATALAICCNPFGYHLPAYAIMLFTSTFKQYITEWKVTDIDDASMAYGALPLMLMALVAGVRAKSALRDVLIFLAVAFLMFSAARNVAVFCIVAAPMVAAAMTREFAFFAPDTQPPTVQFQRFIYATSGLAFVLVGALLLANTDARSSTGPGLAAVASIEHGAGSHNVLCQDFAWCSYLVGAPHERVFIDGRADPYPPNVWADYVAIARLKPQWSLLLDRYQVDAVLANRNSSIDRALARSSGWRATFVDKGFRVWMRPVSSSRGLRAKARPAA